MEKLNVAKMVKIEAGTLSNRECMIAGGVTMLGMSLILTGFGAGLAIRGFFKAYDGGCFNS